MLETVEEAVASVLTGSSDRRVSSEELDCPGSWEGRLTSVCVDEDRPLEMPMSAGELWTGGSAELRTVLEVLGDPVVWRGCVPREAVFWAPFDDLTASEEDL